MTVGAKAVADVEGRTLSGAAIISAVKDAGCEYVLSVPDLHTSQGVLKRVATDNELKLVRVCKEDECLGIAAGLTYGDKRALILIQYTGFLYAMNAIRAIACEHDMPMVMMIGLLAKEPDVAPRDSKRFGVRIMEPMLDVIGIDYHYIDTDADIPKIKPAIEKAYATSRPVALLIGRRPRLREVSTMMNRRELLEILKKNVTNEIVVSSYSTASDWIDIADRPLNYFWHGAMGLCSSHGLGLALARPERKVIVLDGDGSLLMNLGTLVTLAVAAPRNFLHFVLQNGTYEANGGHPIVNQKVDFEGIARSSGWKNTMTISQIPDFEAKLPGLLKNDGPAFVALTIEQGPLGPRSYDEMYKAERREAMRRELAKG